MSQRTQRLRGVELEGVWFAELTEQQTIATVLERLRESVGGWVCPVNLDVLRQCAQNADLKSLVNSADIVVVDGTPLWWLARLRATPLPERVAGSSLVFSLPQALAAGDRTVFLLGGNPGAADGAAAELRRRSPHLSVVGTLCPPLGFEHDAHELAVIDIALTNSVPDVVFVGLGFPKQDRLIVDLRARFPRMWFISCGISFSFVTGEVRRAPRWLQILGLEWVHRLCQEPRRLFRRYVVLGIPFAAKLFVAAIGHRARRPPSSMRNT
jgi:N-acetylglucosaminyldiphosphoundecaprenol N-acetyl-beta-D-mannosaminyltransferase